MSHAKRRTGARHPSRKGQSIARIQKRTIFAPVVGLGMSIVLVIGLALLIIIGHEGNTVNASGGNSPGYGSLNHAKGACGNVGQAPAQRQIQAGLQLNRSYPRGLH